MSFAEITQQGAEVVQIQTHGTTKDVVGQITSKVPERIITLTERPDIKIRKGVRPGRVAGPLCAAPLVGGGASHRLPGSCVRQCVCQCVPVCVVCVVCGCDVCARARGWACLSVFICVVCVCVCVCVCVYHTVVLWGSVVASACSHHCRVRALVCVAPDYDMSWYPHRTRATFCDHQRQANGVRLTMMRTGIKSLH